LPSHGFSRDGNRMPIVHANYETPPNEPLISTGDTSLMYLGVKNENKPAEYPYMSLPIANKMKDGIHVSPTPTSKITLQIIMAFHLP
jgi:hypothetical protein